MKNEVTKQQNIAAIKSAASQLFFLHGIDTTTMNQIAAASGVSKVSIYKHFDSKYAIAYDIYTEYLSVKHQGYTEMIGKGGYSDCTGAEQLGRILDCFIMLSAQDPLFYALFVEYNLYLLRNIPDVSTTRRLYEHLDTPLKSLFLDALDKGLKDGTLATGDSPQIAYEMIIGMLRGVCMTFFLKYAANLNQERFEQLHAQLVHVVDAAMAMLAP